MYIYTYIYNMHIQYIYNIYISRKFMAPELLLDPFFRVFWKTAEQGEVLYLPTVTETPVTSVHEAWLGAWDGWG